MVRVFSRFMTFACVTATLAGAALSGCSVSQGFQPFDENKLVLMQFQAMTPGEDIAVVETTAGDFTMRFFPSEAPKTVENFIQLAQQGYFNGEQVTKIERGEDADGNPTGRLIAGAKGKLGKNGKVPQGKTGLDTPIKEEISYNLAHFPGAVAAYTTDGFVDSRFFIVGNHQVCKEELEDIKADNYPTEIVTQFEKVGGYPEYWMNSSIFAQVIEGLDVVDQIIELSQDAKDGRSSVVITRISIEKYKTSEEAPEQD